MSETNSCRDYFAPFLKGNGVDLGFGGNPISPSAICIDRAEGHPHRAVVPEPVPPTHFVGDVRELPFKDGVLDWVYSSHVLEDFTESETMPVLKEWLRVIRPGGYLLLFLPDQPTYVKYCDDRGELPNQAHQVPHFGPDYVRKCLAEAGGNEIIELRFPFEGNAYSFSVIAKRI